jgi:hypothetical protein
MNSNELFIIQPDGYLTVIVSFIWKRDANPV